MTYSRFETELWAALVRKIEATPAGGNVSQAGFQRLHRVGFVRAGSLFDQAAQCGLIERRGDRWVRL